MSKVSLSRKSELYVASVARDDAAPLSVPKNVKPRWYKRTIGFLALVLVIGLSQTSSAQSFVHPGGLHTKADLDRMKAEVAAGAHPWIDGWNLFITDRKAQNTYRARPGANMPSRQSAQDDATAMY